MPDNSTSTEVPRFQLAVFNCIQALVIMEFVQFLLKTDHDSEVIVAHASRLLKSSEL